MKIRRILCPTDFSEFSRQLLDYGMELADRLGARLYIFHSVPMPRSALYGTGVYDQSGEYDELEKEALEKIRQLVGNRSLDWEPVVVSGDPVEKAEQIICEREMDMAVVASYVHSGLRRFLIGTVVERLVRTSAVPLLVIRAYKSYGKIKRPPDWKRIVMGCTMLPENMPAYRYGVIWQNTSMLKCIFYTPLKDRWMKT